MENHSSVYLAGQGAVYISALSNNLPVGYKFVGDVESLGLTPAVQRTEIIENVTGGRAIGSSFFSSVAYNLAIANRSIKAEHLALAVQSSAATVVAGSVTDEEHIGQQGMMIKLARQNVSTVVVGSDPAATVYTVDVDYIVHAESGLIEILATGTIANGTPLLIDYAFTTQYTVSANPQNVPVALLFAGVNMTNNERIRCEIYRCKLDPAGFDLVNAAGAQAQRAGVVELDTSRAAGDQLFKWDVTA